MTAEPGGWWRRDGPTARSAPSRSTTPSASTAATPLPRPAQPLAAARGARSEPHRRPDPFAWTDDGWRGPRDGPRRLGGVSTSCTSAPSPRGHLRRGRGRLDHLVALGVDVVELMPVAAFPGRWGWGYDGVAPVCRARPATAVRRPRSGSSTRATPAGSASASTSCYNHLGPSGNYLARFGPYFTDGAHDPVGAGGQPRRTRRAEQVRRFLVDNALRWFRDFHVDALRLDAVHELQGRPRRGHYLWPSCPTRSPRCRPSSAGRSTSSPRATSTTRSW